MRAAWITHLILCVPVVYWVTVVCGIPLWLYVVAMVIPGNAILLIRSFAEHRARADMHERTTTVEGSWLLGPLFLFNNLHSLHHEEPGLPWYRYNARYRVRRDGLLAENGGQVYCDVLRRRATLPVQDARPAAASAGTCAVASAPPEVCRALGRVWRTRQPSPARSHSSVRA